MKKFRNSGISVTLIFAVILFAAISSGCGGGGVAGGATSSGGGNSLWTLKHSFASDNLYSYVKQWFFAEFLCPSVYADEDFNLINGADAKDENNIMAVTGRGKVLKTTDGGSTWSIDRNQSQNLMDIKYDASSDTWFRTGGDSTGLMEYSTDGGSTWNALPKNAGGLSSTGFGRKIKKSTGTNYIITNQGIGIKRNAEPSYFCTNRCRSNLGIVNPFFSGTTSVEEIGENVGETVNEYFIAGTINGEILISWVDSDLADKGDHPEKYRQLCTIPGNPSIRDVWYNKNEKFILVVGEGAYKITKRNDAYPWYHDANAPSPVITTLLDANYHFNRIKVSDDLSEVILAGYSGSGASQTAVVATSNGNCNSFATESTGGTDANAGLIIVRKNNGQLKRQVFDKNTVKEK
ncbi:MAG: hypothetical protein ACD_58C00162G0002 [uncultured bacterium]|nr:MAG: hypothetical protein ACD_58C00162G0002 [uncultured bacterium]